MSLSYPPDVAQALAAPGVAERLGKFAGRLSYHAAVSSTNDVALELVRSGAPEGTCVAASGQTAGRGRRGRTWFSPMDVGVYLSVVLRDLASPAVTLLAGVAAAEAIRATTGVPVDLEWPNDLVWSSTPRAGAYQRAKLGGVLTEVADDSDGTTSVVVGIGVNVVAANYPEDIQRDVTCLAAHAEAPVTRGAVLVEILAALSTWHQRCASQGMSPMLARWRELAPSSEGVTVAWEGPDGRRSGVTTGIDPDGSLRVRVGDRVERIVGGTLDWQPSSGGGRS